MVASVPHVFATTPATPAPPASQLDDNFNALIAAINVIVIPTASTPRSYLAGMTLSNDGVTPNSIIDIATGQATDSTNAFTIILASPITKSTAGNWLAGSGNNGMGKTLTIAATTWYHVFAIINGGVADAYFDTSIIAANAPSSTTAFRRIGSILTDGSAHIIAFFQNGDQFLWSVTLADVNGVASLGTSAVLKALTVPPGVQVNALFHGLLADTRGAGSSGVLFSSPNESDQAPVSPTVSLEAYGTSGVPAAADFSKLTNTVQQIRYRATVSDPNVALTIGTYGWIDTRGRNL